MIHDLSDLQEKLEIKFTDFSSRSESAVTNELIDNWGPHYRYEIIEKTHDEIKSFFNHAVSFTAKI